MSLDSGGFIISEAAKLNDRCDLANAIMRAIRSQLRPRVGIETEDDELVRVMRLIWSESLSLQAFVCSKTPHIAFSFSGATAGRSAREWSVNPAAWGPPGSAVRDKCIELFAGEVVAAVQPVLSRL